MLALAAFLVWGEVGGTSQDWVGVAFMASTFANEALYSRDIKVLKKMAGVTK